MSGLAIAGLVVAGVALLTSFVPIVNNAAFVLALVAAVLAIVGIVKTGAGKRRGRGMAVAGLVIAVLSVVIVLVTYSNMAVGQAVDLDNGLSVSVDSVQTGLANYDGSTVTQITVTYKNNGSSNVSFNSYDWKASDANGAQRDETYYTSQENALDYGTLSAGGTVTGTVAFEGDIAKVYYYSSIVQSDSNIAWTLS